MGTPEELRGSYVLVHPELQYDPIGQRGKIGLINSANLEHDTFFVAFESNQMASFSADALMVLRDHGDIYQDILVHRKDMTSDDFKSLLKINLYQQSPERNAIKNALELAGLNETMRKYSLVSLEEKLGLNQGMIQQTAQEQNQVRGR